MNTANHNTLEFLLSTTDILNIISDVFHTSTSEIKNITIIKKGMTNQSLTFDYRDSKYIMRIPGAGTDKLINRRNEASVYNLLKGTSICDDVIYINPENGYKITRFWDNARTCDSSNPEDVQKCMCFLKQFHQQNLKVEHTFDLFQQIEFYESLWDNHSSRYDDYEKTKDNILSLKSYLQKYSSEKCLAHLDAVPDNFLFVKHMNNTETINLIDWEYSAMQDPHVDIAMFCVYAMYDRQQIDHTIQLYFAEEYTTDIRFKIYCYIAICGLLWSNWCEYKRQLGIEFGEYAEKQYYYAKEYYRIICNEL